MKNEHPWVLTAPWYRWSRPGDPRFGRQTVPIFQKYASSRFVDDFLAEPQRSLRYKDEDRVHQVVRHGTRPKFRLSALERIPTSRRKIFLDTHSRFYLVVFELHCDAPGFPSVCRDKVCEAGMVVRRRMAPAPAEGRKALAAALEEATALEARLEAARRMTPTVKAPSCEPPARGARGGTKSPGTMVAEALQERGGKEMETLAEEHAAAHRRLVELADRHGVEVRLEGWIPGEHPGVGAWRPVEETPQQVEEAIVPLWPLVPDPAEANHSAAGRTFYFGVLPTASSDVDETAAPRFDDRSLYEVRCFVRRHDPRCPRTARRRDCKGELVWSRPTEVYQLADAMDLDGTSNRPVTIQLPDLNALEAQAATAPPGTGMGVRMVSPADSSLEFQSDPDDLGNPGGKEKGGPSICFFSIPLITIVATFVLKLFLPIVVFAFGLWFLLKLKFCILPSFSLNVGLAAALQATPPGADFDMSLKTDVEDAFAANLEPDVADKLIAELDHNALAQLALDLSVDFSGSLPPEVVAELGGTPPNEEIPTAPLPAVTARLEYYPRVEVAS